MVFTPAPTQIIDVIVAKKCVSGNEEEIGQVKKQHNLSMAKIKNNLSPISWSDLSNKIKNFLLS